MGLLSLAGFVVGGGRIFRWACSRLIALVGDGLSGTERTEAA